MGELRLRVGIAGLGRAFAIMLPTLRAHPRVSVVAAADPREAARRQFAADFGGAAYARVEELCADARVDAIYVASPHQLHAEHVIAAARAGKHVLVEKPMALTLAECDAMIDAAHAAHVALIVGHSHSFDSPVLRTRALIASGAYGRVRMITAMNYTDYLYRPRRPEELDTARGGGAVYNQAAHQVDVVRMLAGSRAASVRAATGAWDPARRTEGAYTALLTFDDGVAASLTYSGYAHFDSDEFCAGIGELGQPVDRARYGRARAALTRAGADEGEVALKNERNYGGAAQATPPPAGHNHFGFVLASCERADLRPLPTGVMIYDDTSERLDELHAPAVPRAEVIDELADAVAGIRPVHTGEWGRATLEICLAMLASSREGREVALHRQVGLDDMRAGASAKTTC
jgi:phthalate 4,5-cis-dihydrodiol dehydrogenase